jgi:hypothetical protein
MGLLLGRDFRVAFPVINIGYALNTLIPLRLGDAMKMYLSNKFYGVPLISIFSASVAEKLADLSYLLLLGIIVVVLAAGELVQVSMLYSVAAFVAVVTTIIILFRLYIVKIVRLLPKKSRLRRISIELHKHAGVYPVKRILLVSLGIWALNVALILFAFNTYLPDLRISILDATTLLLILSFAIAIPSAPAGIGFFEASIVAYLTHRFAVGNEAALAAATAFHLVNAALPLFVFGVLLLRRSWVRNKPCA